MGPNPKMFQIKKIILKMFYPVGTILCKSPNKLKVEERFEWLL